MMRVHRLLSITACLLLAVSQLAHAANIQVFNNRATWEAAATSSFSSITTEEFADSTLDGGLSISAGSVGNGVFSGSAMPGVFTNPGKFNFQHGVLSFGGDWDLNPGGAGAGILLTATFDDNTTQVIGTILNSPPTAFNGFFGFVSDKPVIAITHQSTQLTGQSELFTLDNASFRGNWWWWWGPGGIWFAFIIIIVVVLFLVTKKKWPRPRK